MPYPRPLDHSEIYPVDCVDSRLPPAGGSVAVRIVEEGQPNSAATISVEDTGIGISPDDLRRRFFFRLPVW